MILEIELREADLRIGAARERIAAQDLLIAQREIDGGDTREAQETLQFLRRLCAR